MSSSTAAVSENLPPLHDNPAESHHHEAASTASDRLSLASPPPPPPSIPLPVAKQPSTAALSHPDLTQRSVTDPAPSKAVQNYILTSPPPMPTLPARRRNHSPYSRSHMRTRSGPSLLSAPIMTRAKSMPSPPTTHLSDNNISHPAPLLASPRRSPPRTRSPFTPGHDVDVPRSPGRSERVDGGASGLISGVPTIEEDSELDMTPRQNSQSMHAPLHTVSAAFLRSASLRRRPASPLHSANIPSSTMQSPPTSYPGTTDSSTASSPKLLAQRYVNEAYPALHHSNSTSSFSASSVPSTPSSVRSRSPSISSLDTIEDAPDAESAAAANAEIERLERLHSATDTQERLKRAGLAVDDDLGSDGGARRRSSFESGRMGRGLGRAGHQTGERKRWSICGGERRADLDLETIWED